MAYSSPPSVTSGVSPVKGTHLNLLRADLDDHEARILALEGSSRLVLSADPSSPVEGQWWLFRDGGSPESLSLRVRISGVTVSFNLGTSET